MNLIYQVSLILHVLTGGLAVCLFWVPALMRKGGLDHKIFGRYYSWCMYGVAWSGIVMASLLIIMPRVMLPEFAVETAANANRIHQIQVFSWFLIHLAVLIWVSVLYGQQVIKFKTNRSQLKQPVLLSLLALLAVNGSALVVYGLFNGLILQVVFGLLGIATATSYVTYMVRRKVAANTWLREHLSAYIGSGIGAYTAFLVFGGRQLLAVEGQWQLVLWIAPGVIGSLCIAWLSRKYAPRGSKRV